MAGNNDDIVAMILEDVAKNRKSMLKESINIVALDYLKKLVNKDKTSI